MDTRRKGKGASRPKTKVVQKKGRKVAETPSKRITKVTARHIGAHAQASTARRQARRDSR